MDSKFKAFIVNTLRKASYRWPPRSECLKAARVDRGYYSCNMCKNTFHRKEITLDHIIPVVKLSGFTTWDNYIERMFPNSEGFQALCNQCHDTKTMTENNIRKKLKKVDKQKKKR